MTPKALLAIAIPLPALLALGCNSPLLNHARAAPLEPPRPDALSDGRTAPCPIDFARSGLCAELTWDSALNDQDPASFRLRFWNRQGTSGGPYVDPGLDVSAKLWMPAMGHGSAPVTVTPARDAAGQSLAGVYDGSGAFFVMPGDWELHLQLKQGTVVREEAVVSVHI